MRQASTVKRTTVKPLASQNRIDVSAPQKISKAEDSNQKVAEKAYQLFVARGYKNGHDLEDWIEAERIIKGFKK